MGRGDVAQLGERRTCTAEAVGSNPIISIAGEARRFQIEKFWNLQSAIEIADSKIFELEIFGSACSRTEIF